MNEIQLLDRRSLSRIDSVECCRRPCSRAPRRRVSDLSFWIKLQDFQHKSHNE